MPQLSLFDDDPAPPASPLAATLQALAGQGIFFGASSWKYPGWIGSIYSSARYSVRGKFSQRKFDQECLAEYAQTFPVVCGDFSFYQFPTPEFWRHLFDSSPSSLRFAFKVPEEITVALWPTHPRYGTRGGQPNPSFLDAEVMNAQFANLLYPYRDRVVALILEFGAFSRRVFPHPSQFVEKLDAFLRQLAPGLRYAVEIRNPDFFETAYFETLARHNTAHVMSAWTRMPTLAEQADLADAYTADFVVARALLRHGRAYEHAVRLFSPYHQIQEPDPTSRDGLYQIALTARHQKKPAFLFVNNRLEGFAPGTIEAVANALI